MFDESFQSLLDDRWKQVTARSRLLQIGLGGAGLLGLQVSAGRGPAGSPAAAGAGGALVDLPVAAGTHGGGLMAVDPAGMRGFRDVVVPTADPAGGAAAGGAPPVTNDAAVARRLHRLELPLRELARGVRDG